MASHCATQLVETSVEDSFLAVAKFMGDILDKDETSKLKETAGSRLTAKAQACLADGSHGELLNALLNALPAVLNASPADADLACVTHIVCHVAARAAATAGSAAPAEAVVAAATAADKPATGARLAMLMSLYNALGSMPAAQLRVLLAAMAFATRTGQADALAHVATGKADKWAAAFGLEGADKRELLVGIAELLAATSSPAQKREAFALQSQALSLVKAGDAAGLAATVALAAKAVKTFVCSATLFQCDLATFPAVQQLEHHKTHAPLFAVLSAMLNGDMAAFQKADLKCALEPGATTDALTEKMKRMCLIVLCAKHLHKEMPFSAVQEGLGLKEEEVELAIVRAIAAKLIDARIDQLRRVIVVTRAVQLRFGDAEWRTLAADLERWGANLADVSEMVRQQVLTTGITA